MQEIINREKPDLLIFFVFSPVREYVDLCKELKIKYLYILYDTFISRPNAPENAAEIESYCIENSCGYFVPSFFYPDYAKKYNTLPQVKSYDLPLLVRKEEVIEAYNRNKENRFSYSYFGQIQAFRKAEEIKKLLRKLNIHLDVFSTMNYDSDDVFTVYPAVSDRDLFDVVAASRFLIAFDNGAPFEKYLPLKAYLYVSFTKPIICVWR